MASCNEGRVERIGVCTRKMKANEPKQTLKMLRVHRGERMSRIMRVGHRRRGGDAVALARMEKEEEGDGRDVS
jgi:hypothetical protein